MHLVQLFLPLYDNAGQPFAREAFERVREELTDRFGGATAYVRSPAVGAWEDAQGVVRRDDVFLFEVECDALDRGWWREYRGTLALRFAQEALLVRAIAAERL